MIILYLVLIILIIIGGFYLFKKYGRIKHLKNISFAEIRISGKKGINENLFLGLINSLIKLDFKYFLDFEIVDFDVDNGFKAMDNKERKSYAVLYQFINNPEKSEKAIVYVEFVTFFEDKSHVITRLNNVRMITRNDFSYISKSFYHHLEHITRIKSKGIYPLMLGKEEFLKLYLDVFKRQK